MHYAVVRRRPIENRTWGSEAHISEKWYPNIIRKCDNDRESYDDRKCDNDRESYRVPKKSGPRKKGFWPFSLAGWFYMDRNNAVWSGHIVAPLWIPHLPIFGKKLIIKCKNTRNTISIPYTNTQIQFAQIQEIHFEIRPKYSLNLGEKLEKIWKILKRCLPRREQGTVEVIKNY